MKKVGILTFQSAYNYGAALQAYASKSIIGENSEIINYNNEHFKKIDPFFYKEKRIDKRIIKIIYKNKSKKRIARFDDFQNEFLVNKNDLINKDDLTNINDKYEVFITGSDQVWNLDCSGKDKAYFLDFVVESQKKNSYAASFGSEKLSTNKELISELIKDYSNISVREKSGKKIVKDLIGKEVPVVLDPTMLLTSKEWDRLIGEKIVKAKYILVYTVLNGNKILDFAKKVSKITGFKIYCITTSLKPYPNIHCVRDAGPLEWINLIKNAEIVITNSFHGLAFSLIYNKDFYIELLPPPAQTNARIKELLEDLNLSYRVIQDIHKVEEKDFKIDYDKVNIILDIKREASLKFLNKVIGKD